MHQHITFHTIHAIQFKPIHMDIFGPTSTSGLFLIVPHPSMGCPLEHPPPPPPPPPFIKNGPKHQTHNMLFIQQAITLQTISHGQSWSNKQSGLFLTFPKVVGCQWGSPLTKHRFHFVEPRIHGHFRPHTHKTINKAPKQGLNQVGENPYLPKFFETQQNWCPRVALAVGSNFASCFAQNRRSDCREIYR